MPEAKKKEPIKYFGMVSELDGIDVKNFPNKFPMFFLGTSVEIDAYNRLMLKAISGGFDPKIRKLCFTLSCREGQTHEDVFNIIKDVPEIDEERYILLSNIVHWNPVVEATRILENYLELLKTMDEARETSPLKEMLDEAFEKARKESPVALTVED